MYIIYLFCSAPSLSLSLHLTFLVSLFLLFLKKGASRATALYEYISIPMYVQLCFSSYSPSLYFLPPLK